MYYTIYKVINKIDGKIYIGKHQTTNPHDGYMGSGKILAHAIKKHGIENFTKEILFIFDNEAEMNAKEAELVTEEFVEKDDNYNICPGGRGGFGYINSVRLNVSGVNKRDYKEISRKCQETKKTRTYSMSEEARKKISENNKITNDSRRAKVSAANKGRKKTEEHKRKISESVKRRAFLRKLADIV